MAPLNGEIILRVARRFGGCGVIVNEHVLDSKQTRFHVEVLSRTFDFIQLNETEERLSRPSKRPWCLLTFDDGKRSNATEVAPELRKLGVPAVFYLSTGFVGSASPLWFDRYR